MAQWARMYTRFNANGARVTAPHTLESLVLRAGTVRTFNLSTLVFWAALLRPALTAPPTHTRIYDHGSQKVPFGIQHALYDHGSPLGDKDALKKKGWTLPYFRYVSFLHMYME